VRGLIELLLALVVMQSLGHCSGLSPWLTCLATYAVVSVRAIYSETFDVIASIFAVAYVFTNIFVNAVDYTFFKVT
jgi:hypothetical protein